GGERRALDGILHGRGVRRVVLRGRRADETQGLAGAGLERANALPCRASQALYVGRMANTKARRKPKARAAQAASKPAQAQAKHRLLRTVDAQRDHIRGSRPKRGLTMVVIYGDYLCPYCRRLKGVLDRLRTTLGDKLSYAYRQFPNEKAHPGAEF